MQFFRESDDADILSCLLPDHFQPPASILDLVRINSFAAITGFSRSIPVSYVELYRIPHLNGCFRQTGDLGLRYLLYFVALILHA